MNIKYLFLLILTIKFIQINGQVLSTYPIHNSVLNNPETNIAIIFNMPLDITKIFEGNIIVTGSKSGVIKYQITFSDNNRILIIDPENDFILGEQVFITFNKPLFSISGVKINISHLLFNIKNDIPLNKLNYEEHLNKRKNDGFPSVTVNIYDNPAPGKIFFHNLSALASDNDRYYGIMENNGTSYFSVQDNNKGLNFTLQKNGYITYWDDKNFLMIDSSYSPIDTFACGNGYDADWHEFQITSDGHAFLLAWDVQVIDMSKIVEGGQEYATVEGVVIQELDENKNVVFQWRSWDHFNITDAEDVDFTTSYVSYVHGNALDIDTDGNILLSCRLMNEITKINKTTGDIMWRLGGKNNQFTFINDNGFCRQHDVRRISNGNITLFDNGECHETQVSRAVEYNLDEINKTATLVWEYKHPKNIYSETMGNVQRLSNGNTFINWGRIPDSNMTGDNLFPAITEVRPNKEIAYELTFDKFFHMLYRSYRFEWEVPSPLSSINNITELNKLIQIYPNPASNILRIRVNSHRINETSIRLYNNIGQLVKQAHFIFNGETDVMQLNISELNSGIYFCVLESNNIKVSRKVIVSKS